MDWDCPTEEQTPQLSSASHSNQPNHPTLKTTVLRHLAPPDPGWGGTPVRSKDGWSIEGNAQEKFRKPNRWPCYRSLGSDSVSSGLSLFQIRRYDGASPSSTRENEESN